MVIDGYYPLVNVCITMGRITISLLGQLTNAVDAGSSSDWWYVVYLPTPLKNGSQLG